MIASAIGPHVPNLGAVVTLFGAIGYCCFLVPESERRRLCIFGEGVSGYYGG